MPATSVQEQLRLLHAHYTERINSAVEAGRMDLARDLADACEDEALEMMLDEEERVPSGLPVEVLELGPVWPRRPAGRWATWRRLRRRRRRGC